MSDITDIIEQQMKTADRQFEVLLKFAADNRSAIRNLVDALGRVSGVDKKALEETLADLEASDEEIVRLARSSEA